MDLNILPAWMQHPVMAGAMSGLGGAMIADYAAFRSWKSFHDAASYAWGTAIWRWLQGFVGGAVAAIGWGAL